ncbi:MAG: TolC family protein, partial [Sphingomonadales bacterium]
KQSYEASKLKTHQRVEELTYDVTGAYLGVLQQQKVVNLAQQNLVAHRYILNLVTAQKEAGQGTAADVNRVSSSLSNAESFMLEEESKLQQSRDQYRRLLDAPPGLLVDPIIDLSLLPQTAEDAAARSVTESPQLLQVKADERSIKNQLRSQRGNYLPKVEMEVQGNLRTDVAGETGSIRDARAMMFLRYNVFNGGADTAVASRLRARVKEIGYEFEKQKRTVEQDIRNDFTAIDASRAKIETISDQVDAAQEVVRLYEEQFRAGDRTAFDLLDAQQALINAKLEQVLNKYQETRAAYRVLQQLGSLYYALTSQD